MKNRTRFVIISIVNITWYSIAVLVLSYLDKEVPDSLTVAWFSAWTAELAILAGIKLKETNAELEEKKIEKESSLHD